jgi:hypothetical protein
MNVRGSCIQVMRLQCTNELLWHFNSVFNFQDLGKVTPCKAYVFVYKLLIKVAVARSAPMVKLRSWQLSSCPYQKAYGWSIGTTPLTPWKHGSSRSQRSRSSNTPSASGAGTRHKEGCATIPDESDHVREQHSVMWQMTQNADTMPKGGFQLQARVAFRLVKDRHKPYKLWPKLGVQECR